MSEELRKRVVEQIKAAFADTPYPGDKHVGRYEVDRVRGHWQDLSLETIRIHRDGLWYFSPEGFRHYLPAFLLAVLIHHDEVDTLTYSLIHALTPPQPESGLTQAFSKRVATFDNKEQEAIRAFLLSYQELFPYDNWAFIISEQEDLENAIKFWTNPD